MVTSRVLELAHGLLGSQRLSASEAPVQPSVILKVQRVDPRGESNDFVVCKSAKHAPFARQLPHKQALAARPGIDPRLGLAQCRQEM